MSDESETYKVCITETLELVKDVEATSAADAVAYVTALYRAGEIVLTGDNANADYKIETL